MAQTTGIGRLIKLQEKYLLQKGVCPYCGKKMTRWEYELSHSSKHILGIIQKRVKKTGTTTQKSF
jgi:hypothetical protein